MRIILLLATAALLAAEERKTSTVSREQALEVKVLVQEWKLAMAELTLARQEVARLDQRQQDLLRQANERAAALTKAAGLDPKLWRFDYDKREFISDTAGPAKPDVEAPR